jgi:hypothetical protein
MDHASVSFFHQLLAFSVAEGQPNVPRVAVWRHQPDYDTTDFRWSLLGRGADSSEQESL